MLEAKGDFQVLSGRSVIAFGCIQHAQVVVRFGEGRVDRKGLFERRFRAMGIAGSSVGPTQIVTGSCARGVLLHHVSPERGVLRPNEISRVGGAREQSDRRDAETYTD